MGCNESKQQQRPGSPASYSLHLAPAFEGVRDSIEESAPLMSKSIGEAIAGVNQAVAAAGANSMGQPDGQQRQPQPQPSHMLSLSRQHERLILELFSFKDARQFHEWLTGPSVRGSWLEFRRDSTGAPLPARAVAEIDKARAAQQAKDAIKSKSAKYLLHYPDKTGWTLDDHIVRFIAVVISDNILGGLWSSGDWSSRGIEIAKSVYEVLIFLRSTDSGLEAGPPGYSA